MRYIPVLTIAGSDSSGGAGVQADIKTMSALGCFAASAITSLTVQNTMGVTAVMAVTPDVVGGQIRAVIDDIHPLAVKIGMVNDAATIHAIAEALDGYDVGNLVVDPVMVATSGSALMQPDALDAFCAELLPRATVLTPNVPEAEVLAGIKIAGSADIMGAGRAILERGAKAVLIKGGHLSGDKTDYLFRRLPNGDGVNVEEFAGVDVDTRNTHGTGCTLSSAIASFMARGYDLSAAVRQAKDYVQGALEAGAGVMIGQGHGPVNHFFNPQKLIKQ